MAFDGSPLKIFDGDACQTYDIYARCISFQSSEFGPIDLLPMLSRPPDVTATGIMGCLKLGDLRLARCRDDELKAHYLYAQRDGAQTNESIPRHICSELHSENNLLIAHCIGWHHTFSLSVLGPLADFDFGDILRTCHVLDTNRPFPIAEFAKYCIARRWLVFGKSEPLCEPLMGLKRCPIWGICFAFMGGNYWVEWSFFSRMLL